MLEVDMFDVQPNSRVFAQVTQTYDPIHSRTGASASSEYPRFQY